VPVLAVLVFAFEFALPHAAMPATSAIAKNTIVHRLTDRINDRLSRFPAPAAKGTDIAANTKAAKKLNVNRPR
jgi:hypothetical protein